MNPTAKEIADYLRNNSRYEFADYVERLERKNTKLFATNIAYAHALERPIIININNGKATVEKPSKAKL